MEITAKDIALITTEVVTKTFNNKDAYLHAVILPIKNDTINKKKTYKVRTDLVGYKEVEIVQFDENNQQYTETQLQLVFLEQKQDWSVQEFTYAEIDDFAIQVAELIPENLSKTEKEIMELQTMFLIKRQEDAPWGVASNKWKIRTNNDLLKDTV